MEPAAEILQIDPFLTMTPGIIVLFVDKRLNNAVGFPQELGMPEPVTGGLSFSVLFGIVYAATGVAIQLDLAARDILLGDFITTTGIDASFENLLAGGKPLAILLAMTIACMIVQNLPGISGAALFDLPSAVSLPGGTVSLIGGHGTATPQPGRCCYILPNMHGKC